MKTLATDENNDIYLTNNGYTFLEGKEAVAAVAENVLRTHRGELQFDVTRGIPWFETVFSSIRNLPAWSAQMVIAIKKVQGVTGLVSFDYQLSGSLVEYVAKIKTIYGETEINV